jgi:transposase
LTHPSAHAGASRHHSFVGSKALWDTISDDDAPKHDLVERFFNKIKQCRRVATRYDKLAANYLAFIQLASIRLWLRVNESAS